MLQVLQWSSKVASGMDGNHGMFLVHQGPGAAPKGFSRRTAKRSRSWTHCSRVSDSVHSTSYGLRNLTTSRGLNITSHHGPGSRLVVLFFYFKMLANMLVSKVDCDRSVCGTRQLTPSGVCTTPTHFRSSENASMEY